MQKDKVKKILDQYRLALKNQGVVTVSRKAASSVHIYSQYRVRHTGGGNKGYRLLVPTMIPMEFDAVNLDINNTCNLRCKFCFNQFNEPPVLMDEPTFKQILPILSHVKDSCLYDGMGFYFSCLYEPTIAPDFLKLLKLIPKQGLKKAFLTTNLCKTFSENEIKEIIGANIHHINISIETMQKERYKEICGSVQFEHFKDNLYRLGKVYQKTAGRKAKLRFISMVLKSNIDELPDIIKLCHTKIGAYQSELRTPFPGIYTNMEWNAEQFLSREVCGEFEAALKAMPYKTVWNLRPEDEMPIFTPEMLEEAKQTAVSELGELEPMNTEYFFVRISSAGMIHFNGLNESISANDSKVNEAYFCQKLRELYKRRNEYFFVTDNLAARHLPEIQGKLRLTSYTHNDMSVELRGVLAVPEQYALCDWHLICSSNAQCAEFLLDKTPCGVGKFRFYCCMGKDYLGSKADYSAKIAFYQGDELVGYCKIKTILGTGGTR